MAPSSYGMQRPDSCDAIFRNAIKQNGQKWRRTAWFLTACRDPQFRDYSRAIEQTNEAIELDPQPNEFWMTLGAAQYRAGEYQQAHATLRRAIDINAKHGNNSRPADLAFFAMAQYQLGRPEVPRPRSPRFIKTRER